MEHSAKRQKVDADDGQGQEDGGSGQEEGYQRHERSVPSDDDGGLEEVRARVLLCDDAD